MFKLTFAEMRLYERFGTTLFPLGKYVATASSRLA